MAAAAMDINNLYPPVQIHDADDSDVARNATVSLLGYLLANPPFLPASLLSRDVIRRHSILDLSPEEAEDYLVTDCYPSQHANVPAKTVQNLRALNAQVEQLDVLYASGDPRMLLHDVRFQSPEVDHILVAIDLGDTKQQRDPLLTLFLRLEGHESEQSAYRYDNLLPADINTGEWFSTMQQARQNRSRGVMTRSRPPSRLAFQEPLKSAAHRKASVASHATSVATSNASFHTAGAGDSSAAATPSEDGAGHEDGQEPELGAGEYFNNADDFWAGVKDDEDETEHSPSTTRGDLNDDHAETEVGDDASRRQAQEEEDRYWAMYDQQEPYGESMYDKRLSAGALAHRKLHGNGAGSVASIDRTALATRDENATTHATATDTSESDSAASDIGVDARDDEPFRVPETIEERATPVEEEDDEHEDQPKHKDEHEEDRDDPVEEDKVDELEESEARERQTSHPPPPESVGGLSYYETPADMSLNDIERYYREMELRRKIEARERIQRAVYGDVIDEGDEGKELSAGNIPGIPPNRRRKSTAKSKAKQDPIEALASAEHNVVVADQPKKETGGTIPQRASMETLRKLAEEQQKADVDWKGEKTGDDATSLTGSRAGGFKNFLQMAPSVVTDSSEWDTQSAAPSVVNLPEAVAEEEDDDDDVSIGGLSTKTDHSQHSNSDSQVLVNKSAIARAAEHEEDKPATRPASATFSAGANGPTPNRGGAQLNSMEDLEAFLFPGRADQKEKTRKEEEAKRKAAKDEEKRRKAEVARAAQLREQRKSVQAKAKDAPKTSAESVAPSDTFIPGASTDASTHPLRAVKLDNIHKPQEKSSLRQKPADSPSLADETGSTSTNLGSVALRSKENFNRNSTARIMQDHLRQQRQQALQIQRERQQQLRGKSTSNAASKAVKIDGIQVGRRREEQEEEGDEEDGGEDADEDGKEDENDDDEDENQHENDDGEEEKAVANAVGPTERVHDGSSRAVASTTNDSASVSNAVFSAQTPPSSTSDIDEDVRPGKTSLHDHVAKEEDEDASGDENDIRSDIEAHSNSESEAESEARESIEPEQPRRKPEMLRHTTGLTDASMQTNAQVLAEGIAMRHGEEVEEAQGDEHERHDHLERVEEETASRHEDEGPEQPDHGDEEHEDETREVGDHRDERHDAESDDDDDAGSDTVEEPYNQLREEQQPASIPSGLPGILPFADADEVDGNTNDGRSIHDDQSVNDGQSTNSPQFPFLPPLPKDKEGEYDVSPAQATNGFGQELDEKPARHPAQHRLAEYHEQENSDPSDDGDDSGSEPEEDQNSTRERAAVSPLAPLPPALSEEGVPPRMNGNGSAHRRDRLTDGEQDMRDGSAAARARARFPPEVQNGAHQQDRANAARLAKRRREYAQGIKARNESVKMILKGAWRLLDETAAAMEGSSANDGIERMGEAEFLRLAREAVREGLQEKRSAFS